MKSFLLSTSSLIALAAGTTAGLAQTAKPTSVPGTVLLETIEIDTQSAGAAASPPSYAAQAYRFMRRPGAETVVSVAEQAPGVRGNLRSVLSETPGVYAPERTAGSQGLISIRGTDISAYGPRSGRGIRTYVDNIPIGRTDAGITTAFLDPLAADYIEIYRGPNSLRYGSITTGGAFNIVSKTGQSAPGTTIGTTAGSKGYTQSWVENGGTSGAFDWFVHSSFFHNDGFQTHTNEENKRLNANVGWRPSKEFETRFYVALGKTDQELSNTVKLKDLDKLGFKADATPLIADTDANFEFGRVANRTTFRFGNTSYEIGAYVLDTKFDHLPTPFSGLVDNHWRDYGSSLRIEKKTDLAGLPTELVGGMRANYTSADFLRYQWVDGGKSKGKLTGDWDFESWLVESYGEAAVEVVPKVKLFSGLQWAYTTRVLNDNWAGGTVAAIPLPSLGPGLTQAGRAAALQEYEQSFESLNPKVGVNWEYTPSHFLFANIAKSFEVPASGDLSDVAAINAANPNARVKQVEAQEAWTQEIGVRGGWERFQYDITFYHMTLSNEILTRCATVAEVGNAACRTTVAFNAGSTVHDGIEIGYKAIPFMAVLETGDQIYVNGVWNINEFKFDNDPLFGNRRMPVIPEHQVFSEVGYKNAAGFFVSGNIRHLSHRLSTYDHKGGELFEVPAYDIYGAKIGFKAPDGSWSTFVEGRNLTDKVFVSDFTASPTKTTTSDSPLVRRGDGRAAYAGFTYKF